jgi:putative acetyltransferase
LPNARAAAKPQAHARAKLALDPDRGGTRFADKDIANVRGDAHPSCRYFGLSAALQHFTGKAMERILARERLYPERCGAMLSIAQETPRQEDVSRLVSEADDYSAALYPPGTRHPADIDSLAQPGVRFFVARSEGRAVGCGALALGSAGEAEIKRMVVAADARGQGIGRAILQAIEEAALGEGVRVIRLETGPRSTEALTLYQRNGYRPRGPFGGYPPSQFSTFMEKRLQAGRS